MAKKEKRPPLPYWSVALLIALLLAISGMPGCVSRQSQESIAENNATPVTPAVSAAPDAPAAPDAAVNPKDSGLKYYLDWDAENRVGVNEITREELLRLRREKTPHYILDTQNKIVHAFFSSNGCNGRSYYTPTQYYGGDHPLELSCKKQEINSLGDFSFVARPKMLLWGRVIDLDDEAASYFGTTPIFSDDIKLVLRKKTESDSNSDGEMTEYVISGCADFTMSPDGGTAPDASMTFEKCFKEDRAHSKRDLKRIEAGVYDAFLTIKAPYRKEALVAWYGFMKSNVVEVRVNNAIKICASLKPDSQLNALVPQVHPPKKVEREDEDEGGDGPDKEWVSPLLGGG